MRPALTRNGLVGNGSEWLILVEIRLPPEGRRDHLVEEYASLAIRGLGLPEEQRGGLLETLSRALNHPTWLDNPSPIVLMRVRISPDSARERSRNFGNMAPGAPDENSPGSDLVDPKDSRGWGYFVIEKTVGESGFSDHCIRVVDLYLYRE